MLEYLPLLDGWKYVFPYFQENVPITSGGYTTLYNSKDKAPNGYLIFAVLVTNTANYRIKLSEGDTDLHNIDVKGLLYGQAPSGNNVPSGMIANIYVPITETMTNYSIPVANPEAKPVTTILFETADGLPYKDGIEMQIKPDTPPMTVYEFQIGLVSIYDRKAFIKSLKEVL